MAESGCVAAVERGQVEGRDQQTVARSVSHIFQFFYDDLLLSLVWGHSVLQTCMWLFWHIRVVYPI